MQVCGCSIDLHQIVFPLGASATPATLLRGVYRSYSSQKKAPTVNQKKNSGNLRPPQQGATFTPCFVGRMAIAVFLQRSVVLLEYSYPFRPSAAWAFAADARSPSVPLSRFGLGLVWGARTAAVARVWGRAFCFPCGMHFAPPSGALRFDNGRFIMPKAIMTIIDSHCSCGGSVRYSASVGLHRGFPLGLGAFRTRVCGFAASTASADASAPKGKLGFHRYFYNQKTKEQTHYHFPFFLVFMTTAVVMFFLVFMGGTSYPFSFPQLTQKCPRACALGADGSKKK